MPTVKTLSFIIKQLTTKDYFLIPSDLNSIFKELDKVCTEFDDTVTLPGMQLLVFVFRCYSSGIASFSSFCLESQ